MGAHEIPDRWRQASRDELDEHWRAGTLSPAEHERRTTAVRNATTTADLETAVAGLPGLPERDGMLPLGDSGSGQTGPVSYPTPDASSDPARHEHSHEPAHDPSPDSAHYSWHGYLVVLAVFAALILTQTTHTWVWWLLVPMASMFVASRGGSSAASRERRRARRRDIERRRREG